MIKLYHALNYLSRVFLIFLDYFLKKLTTKLSKAQIPTHCQNVKTKSQPNKPITQLIRNVAIHASKHTKPNIRPIIKRPVNLSFVFFIFTFLLFFPFVSLLYHKLFDLSRSFLEFFHRAHLWANFQPSCPVGFISLLTIIIYHSPHKKSIGNTAQFWDFVRHLFRSFCLLTKLLWCDIMEIYRPTAGGSKSK